MPEHHSDQLVVGIAQIAPIWLDRAATIRKAKSYVNKAAAQGCQLVAFGEALIPGYPFWLERTDGARFNSPVQKEIHAHYMQNAVQIEAGHLEPIQKAASVGNIAVIIGCIERAQNRGGHSLYATLVYIDPTGEIHSAHRKLMPTYEERLVWSPGDGHGLQVHRLEAFTVGGLNCWENWLPLVRSSLYAQGEDLHVAIWPGGIQNTQNLTRFIAEESRSFVISASAIMRREDIPQGTPHFDLIYRNSEAWMANGGSAIAGPDGQWVIEPVVNEECLIVTAIDHQRVREERQNMDPSGHYARPDVTQLTVNRERQSTVRFID